MSNVEGKSAPPPLRKRKSKRFNRTNQTSRTAESEEHDEVEIAEEATTAEPEVVVETDATGDTADDTDGGAGADATAGGESDVDGEGGPDAAVSDADDGAQTDSASIDTDNDRAVPTSGEVPSSATSTPSGDTDGSVLTDGPVRTKTLDERSSCGRCGHEVSMINIEVDGNVLVMESCDNCDSRRWHLAGEPIDLQQALDHVGEHAGRRR